jgi:peptide/nickel transport system permease protein
MRRIDPWFVIGIVAFFALLFVALFGDRIAPYEPIYFVVNKGDLQRPFAPGEVFPLGSDVLGRDLFSLVLAGARATLIIAVTAGVARVLTGVAIAAAAIWWRPVRVVTDALSEIISAVPATLIAVLVVIVFIRGDAQIPVFIAALLVTGWAGPYRVARAELARLQANAFTESALALGLGRARVFAIHHLPHLVPILAISTAQQAVASLVAVAELGVLGIFVGATKNVFLTESTFFPRLTDIASQTISEIPEWGGLLANGRGIQNLWTTRWVILVPGVAFALAAMALSAIGLGIARQYQRRNAFYDLRSRGAALLAVVSIIAVLGSSLVPERYAEARAWAADARLRITEAASLERAFADAGLRPLGMSYAVERSVGAVSQTGPSRISVRGVSDISETTEGQTNVLPVLYFASGGAVFDRPLVFAGWGLSPSDHRPTVTATSNIGQPSLGTVVKDWADDYAAVDVRGKVATILKMPTIDSGRGATPGQDFETTVQNALKRGAAAVLYIDPLLPTMPLVTVAGSRVNPYRRLSQILPMERPDGPPVIVLSLSVAERLLAPLGVSPTGIWDGLGTFTVLGSLSGSKVVDDDAPLTRATFARDLGVTAHIELPVARVSETLRHLVARTSDSDPGILIWAVMPATRGSSAPGLDALAAMVETLKGHTGAAFTVVAFDRRYDALGSARALASALGKNSWDLIVVLDDLEGERLRFDTVYGDLIPMFDLYAARAGARAVITRGITFPVDEWTWPGREAFPKSRSMIVRATGAPGDVRPGVAALLGYIAGRAALGAPELHR